jgi:hypothetical protein
MAETTLEVAKRHYLCNEPGLEVGTQRPEGAPRGTVVHIIECQNERCQGHKDRWLVQTNPDGSVPTPGERGPKAFGGLPGNDTNIAQRARDQLRMYEVWSTHPEWDEKTVIAYLNRT